MAYRAEDSFHDALAAEGLTSFFDVGRDDKDYSEGQ